MESKSYYFLLGMYGNEGFFTWDENVCSECKLASNDVTPFFGQLKKDQLRGMYSMERIRSFFFRGDAEAVVNGELPSLLPKIAEQARGSGDLYLVGASAI